MLGERLKSLREDKKITQVKLSEVLNISRDTYAQYEIDRRIPEYSTLEKLADYFEVSLDYLVGRSEYRYIIKNANEMPLAFDLSDDSVIERIPMYNDGVELTVEQKQQFISLYRGIQAANKDWKEKH